jgi:hypothetical protein
MSRRLKAPVPIAQTTMAPPSHGSSRSPHSGCEHGVHLANLLVGDAGIGGQFFMNKTYYSQLIPNTANARVWQTTTRKVNLTQSRSTDDRPRFFEISYFVTSYLVNNGATARNAKEVIELAQVNTSLSNLEVFIKNNGCQGTFQGYAEISDPSGGREETLDVIGKRSFDLVADGAQVGFYLPTTSYQIDPSATTNALAGAGAQYNGLVALSTLAARIAPVVGNTTQIRDQVTLYEDLASGGAVTRILFPPSAVAVEIFWPTDGTEANLTASFAMIEQVFPDAAKNYNPIVAPLVVPTNGGPSGTISVPNATGIIVTNSGAQTPLVVVVTLEP